MGSEGRRGSGWVGWMSQNYTYGRGFFFGPGLPRGLGTLSMAICEAFRFMPGLGPGMPFRLTRFGGGASKLLFVDVC